MPLFLEATGHWLSIIGGPPISGVPRAVRHPFLFPYQDHQCLLLASRQDTVAWENTIYDTSTTWFYLQQLEFHSCQVILKTVLHILHGAHEQLIKKRMGLHLEQSLTIWNIDSTGHMFNLERDFLKIYDSMLKELSIVSFLLLQFSYHFPTPQISFRLFTHIFVINKPTQDNSMEESSSQNLCLDQTLHDKTCSLTQFFQYVFSEYAIVLYDNKVF